MPHDAEVILKICLPRFEEDDLISWNQAFDLRPNNPPNSSGNLEWGRESVEHYIKNPMESE
jgi:hypothetical protein